MLPASVADRQSPSVSMEPESLRIDSNPQVFDVEEPLNLPADLNWLWSMPLNDEDGTQTFDSLLSFANQGLGL